MFCKHCGTEIPNGSYYCPKCKGSQTYTPPQSQPQPQANAVSYPAPKPKKAIYQKWWFWVIVVLVVGAIGSALNNDSTDTTADPTDTVSSTKAAVAVATSKKTATPKPTATPVPDYIKAREKGGFDELTAGGMTEKQADSYIAIAELCDLNTPTQVIVSAKDAENGDMYSLSVTDGDFNIILMARFDDEELVEIVDENIEPLYTEGALNEKYLYWHDVSLYNIKAHAEEAVSSILKAPSTAKYPGGFLDPYSDWEFGKKQDRLYVQSYVDSQNSFGAMIRSYFQIEYQYLPDEGSFQIMRLIFDNEEVYKIEGYTSID